MRAKTVNEIPTFIELYNICPIEIKDILNKAKITPQTATWHPEAPNEIVPHNVYAHIKIVYNRAKKYGDLNLMLAAFFHDLGKTQVTTKHHSIPDKWSAKMHEHVSARLVEKYRDWIESLGGDFDIVYYIVKEHMRAKQLNHMRPVKQEAIRQHKYYDLLHQFTKLDDMKTPYLNEFNK